MAIKYIKHRLKDVRFRPEECIVFPTDDEIKLFPGTLKKLLPDSYSFLRQVREYVRSNDVGSPKAVFFPQQISHLLLVSIVCVDSQRKLMQYNNFFDSMEYLCEHGESETVYIFEELFKDYLVNFEAFEYDIETEFKDADITIVIVNEPKDYKYEIEEAVK